MITSPALPVKAEVAGIFFVAVLEDVVQRVVVVLAIEFTAVAGVFMILVTSGLKFTMKSVFDAVGLVAPP